MYTYTGYYKCLFKKNIVFVTSLFYNHNYSRPELEYTTVA